MHLNVRSIESIARGLEDCYAEESNRWHHIESNRGENSRRVARRLLLGLRAPAMLRFLQQLRQFPVVTFYVR